MQEFDLRTAWIPVMDIAAEMGGICLAPGMHTVGYLHDQESMAIQPIPEERIPEELCRHVDYHPGDVLVFEGFMPHTGLPNATNLYRLSIDVRFYRAENRGYLQGTLGEVVDHWVEIHCDDGVTRRLRIPDDILLRSESGETHKGSELSEWKMPKGGRVMASRRGDTAIYLRPVKFKFPQPKAS
jgi:hypothetical protein